MTPIDVQPHQAGRAPTAGLDHMDTSGPRVRDDMTVEVALSVMAGAHVEHLLLCDEDDQCTSSISRVELSVLRDSSTFTDRLRLKDVIAGPFIYAGTGPFGAGKQGRTRPAQPLSH